MRALLVASRSGAVVRGHLLALHLGAEQLEVLSLPALLQGVLVGRAHVAEEALVPLLALVLHVPSAAAAALRIAAAALREPRLRPG